MNRLLITFLKKLVAYSAVKPIFVKALIDQSIEYIRDLALIEGRGNGVCKYLSILLVAHETGKFRIISTRDRACDIIAYFTALDIIERIRFIIKMYKACGHQFGQSRLDIFFMNDLEALNIFLVKTVFSV